MMFDDDDDLGVDSTFGCFVHSSLVVLVSTSFGDGVVMEST